MQEAQTFSLTSYENEFLQHPDLVMTWATSEAFIARFAEGFAAYTSGDWPQARIVLTETRKARRSGDGRKVFSSSFPAFACISSKKSRICALISMLQMDAYTKRWEVYNLFEMVVQADPRRA